MFRKQVCISNAFIWSPRALIPVSVQSYYCLFQSIINSCFIFKHEKCCCHVQTRFLFVYLEIQLLLSQSFSWKTTGQMQTKFSTGLMEPPSLPSPPWQPTDLHKVLLLGEKGPWAMARRGAGVLQWEGRYCQCSLDPSPCFTATPILRPASPIYLLQVLWRASQFIDLAGGSSRARSTILVSSFAKYVPDAHSCSLSMLYTKVLNWEPNTHTHTFNPYFLSNPHPTRKPGLSALARQLPLPVQKAPSSLA